MPLRTYWLSIYVLKALQNMFWSFFFFSSKFSLIRKTGEKLVKFPLSSMDMIAPRTGTLHRGNNTFLQQPFDFSTQRGTTGMVSACQHSYDDCIQTGSSTVFEQRLALPKFIKPSWIFASNAFEYKLVSPFLQLPNFMRLSSFAPGLLQELPSTSYCLQSLFFLGKLAHCLIFSKAYVLIFITTEYTFLALII